MFRTFNLVEIIVRLPAILLALSVHEFSHGFAAYKLGDFTAKNDGRLSLNPLRHIDPIGFICMILLRFGWAKPVIVNTTYFKDPKQDMALTSFAGPLSNIIFAFVSLIAYYPLYVNFYDSTVVRYILMFLLECFYINVSLGIFNLIPVPPLDGSKIFTVFLPDRWYYNIAYNGQIGFVILLILMYTGLIAKILNPVILAVYRGMFFLVDKIYFFI